MKARISAASFTPLRFHARGDIDRVRSCFPDRLARHFRASGHPPASMARARPIRAEPTNRRSSRFPLAGPPRGRVGFQQQPVGPTPVGRSATPPMPTGRQIGSPNRALIAARSSRAIDLQDIELHAQNLAIIASVGSTNRPTRGGPPTPRADRAAAVAGCHITGGRRKEYEPDPVGTGLDRRIEGDRVVDAADLYLHGCWRRYPLPPCRGRWRR